MSQINTISASYSLKTTGNITAISPGGVANTDFYSVQFTPVGFDKNLVAKWQIENDNVLARTYGANPTLTFSMKSPVGMYGKGSHKLIVTVPTYITMPNSQPLLKANRVTVNVDWHNGSDNADIAASLLLAVDAIMALQSDIVNGRRVY